MCNFVEIYNNIFLVHKILYYCNKKRKTSSEKQNWCGQLYFDVTHFVKLFISMEVTIVTFSFLLVIFIAVYNLESNGFFQMCILGAPVKDLIL